MLAVPQAGYSGTVGYDDQCSFPSCPSGYDYKSDYCTGLKCYKVCEKTITAHCSDSWSSLKTFKNSYDVGVGDKGTLYASGKMTEINTLCYKYANAAGLSITDNSPGNFLKGDSNSHKVIINGWAGVDRCCLSAFGGNCQTGWSTGKRGVNSHQEKTSASFMPYKDDGCSGNTAYGSVGTFDISLNYKYSSWIEEKTETQKVSCPFDCVSNSDCGSKSKSGSEYCDGNVLKQNYDKPICSDYNCDSETTTSTIKTCSYLCENGECVDEPQEEYCGDGICQSNEDFDGCPEDCEEPSACEIDEDCKGEPVICDDGSLWYHGNLCNNGVCILTYDMPPESCFGGSIECEVDEDCKGEPVICDDDSLWYYDNLCDNGICQLIEDMPPESCIGNGEEYCGDGVCQTGENFDNCPEDCELNWKILLIVSVGIIFLILIIAIIKKQSTKPKNNIINNI